MLGRQHDKHHVRRRVRRQLPIDAAQHHRRTDPGHGQRGRRNGELRIFDLVHGHPAERGKREERHLGDLLQRTHDTDRKCVGQAFRNHAHTDSDRNPDPNPNPHADANRDSDAYPDPYADADDDADDDANPETYTDTNADAHPDTDSVADANADSCALSRPNAN